MTHKKRHRVSNAIIAVFIIFAAVLFLMPTVLTIANSFMTSTEISANYGSMFGNMTDEKKTFISENVNLKFIPDKVTFAQYKSVLILNSDYLLELGDTHRTDNGFPDTRGYPHLIRLFEMPEQVQEHNILRLHHTNDNALSGNARAEFPRCG